MMIRIFFAALAIALSVPALSQERRVFHVQDPYEPCEKVTEEDAQEHLYALKCGEGHVVDEAVWLASFDLGRWDGAYTSFTLLGGKRLNTVREPYPRVSSCRARWGCTYFSVASVEIPLCDLFAEKSLNEGLTFKASGGPRDLIILLSATRLRNLREAMIRAGFIAEGDYPLGPDAAQARGRC
jgi:hypothetical protein